MSSRSPSSVIDDPLPGPVKWPTPCDYLQSKFDGLAPHAWPGYVNEANECKRCLHKLYDHNEQTPTTGATEDEADPLSNAIQHLLKKPLNLTKILEAGLRGDHSWIADPSMARTLTAIHGTPLSTSPAVRTLGIARAELILAIKLLAAAIHTSNVDDKGESPSVEWKELVETPGGDSTPIDPDNAARAALALLIRSLGHTALAVRDKTIATARGYADSKVKVPEGGEGRWIDWFTKTRCDATTEAAASLKALEDKGIVAITEKGFFPTTWTGTSSTYFREAVTMIGLQAAAGIERSDAPAFALWRKIDEADARERDVLHKRFKDEIKRNQTTHADEPAAKRLRPWASRATGTAATRSPAATPRRNAGATTATADGSFRPQPSTSTPSGRGGTIGAGGRGRGRGAAVCYNCQATGHVAANCPLPRPQRPTTTSTPQRNDDRSTRQ